MTLTGQQSFGNTLALNTDIRLDVVIKDLCIDEPDYQNRFYVDAIPVQAGWQQSLAIWLQAMLGPYCSNSHILVNEALKAENLRFDSILKPLTDGDVSIGSKATLKVRLELKDLQTVKDGEVKAVRYQLVACDQYLEPTIQTNKIEDFIVSGRFDR